VPTSVRFTSHHTPSSLIVLNKGESKEVVLIELPLRFQINTKQIFTINGINDWQNAVGRFLQIVITFLKNEILKIEPVLGKKSVMKKIIIFVFLIVVAGVSYGQTSPTKKIVGYVPDYGDWRYLDYSKLTHAIFCFLTVKSDGSIPTPTNSYTIPAMDLFLQKAKGAGIKKLIALSGDSLKFVANKEESRNRLVDTLVKFCQYHGFDGIDIDWELIDNATDSSNYTKWMIALSNALKPAGLNLVATIGFGDYWGQWLPDAALKQADWLQIMAYDQTGTWAQSPFGNHSTMDHFIAAENYWVGRGYSQDLLVMGVPFYGYKFKSTSGGLGTSFTYRQINAKFPYLCDTANETPGTDYTFFNGPALIRQKSQYVLDHNLGGIMIWELSKDALGEDALLNQIACTFSNTTCYTKACGSDDSDGTALYFLDPKQQVVISAKTPDAFKFTSEFTIEARVMQRAQFGWNSILTNLNFNNPSSLKGFWFGISGYGYANVQVQNGTSQWINLSGNTFLVDGTWHNIAGVYRSDSLYLIVDGKIDGAAKVSNAVYDNTPVYIGNDLYGESLNGALDELRVWKVARPFSEIIKDAEDCFNSTDPNLVALYHFAEGKNSTKIIDHSGNGNDGSLVNMDEYCWVKGERCSAITGTEQASSMDDSRISLYPNPNNGTFEVNLDRYYREIKIKLIDSFGKEVHVWDFQNSSQAHIQFDGKPGVYLLTISSDGMVDTRKMVIR